MALAVWELIATEPDGGRMDNVVAAYNGRAWSITGHAPMPTYVYNPATEPGPPSPAPRRRSASTT